jgi:hypothetical protein
MKDGSPVLRGPDLRPGIAAIAAGCPKRAAASAAASEGRKKKTTE